MPQVAPNFGKIVAMDSPRSEEYIKEHYDSNSIVIAGSTTATESLTEGTPMAKLTGGADVGKYVKYDSAGANGADVCVGLLANMSIPASSRFRVKADGSKEATDTMASLYSKGKFDSDQLTALGLDATAIGQLDGAVVGNVFSF